VPPTAFKVNAMFGIVFASLRVGRVVVSLLPPPPLLPSLHPASKTATATPKPSHLPMTLSPYFDLVRKRT
jgi:hypothetical protein